MLLLTPPAAAQTRTVASGPTLLALEELTIAAGFVTPPTTLTDDGEVVAAATEGDIEERSLTVFDVVHLSPTIEGRPAVVGDSLLLYFDAGELRHPLTSVLLGRKVYPTAVAAVVEVSGDVASAMITRAFAPVQVGQRAQYLRVPGGPLPEGERIAGAATLSGAGVVAGFRDDAAIIEPYAVVYLDLPPGGELGAGDEVELVRTEVEDGRELPEVSIGAARVVDVGPTAATAVLIQAQRSDLEAGDRYRRTLLQEEEIGRAASR